MILEYLCFYLQLLYLCDKITQVKTAFGFLYLKKENSCGTLICTVFFIICGEYWASALKSLRMK